MKSPEELKKELKAQGYRLPHGYDIVKRKPKAKVAKKVKPVVGKTKAPVRKVKPVVGKTSTTEVQPLPQGLLGKTSTHKVFKAGDKLIGGRIDHKTGKFTPIPQLKECKVARVYISTEKGYEGLRIAVKSGNKTFVTDPFVKRSFPSGYGLEALDSKYNLIYFHKKN